MGPGPGSKGLALHAADPNFIPRHKARKCLKELAGVCQLPPKKQQQNKKLQPKVRYKHTKEYYSAIGKKEILTAALTWLELEENMKREMSQKKKTNTGWIHSSVKYKEIHPVSTQCLVKTHIYTHIHTNIQIEEL